MDLASEKKVLRAAARARRAALAGAMPDHAARLAAHAGALPMAQDALVGGYMALPGEADPGMLMARLAGLGHPLAVPRVAEWHAPLVFHPYVAGRELAPGAFGIAEPDPAAPLVRPHFLLVPLLAFDAAGRRLGYGGGFYDRTLADLRARGSVTAIGVAYAGQQVAMLPADPFDQRLDAVLTETGFHRFARAE